jgi:hypothetical protein
MAPDNADMCCPALAAYFYIHPHPAATQCIDELVSLKTRMQYRRIQILTCFGGSLAEYIFGT